MRKLITILVLILFCAVSYSQTAINNLGDGITFKTWSTDYTLTNTTANEYTWKAAKHYPGTYSYTVSLTKVSGTQDVTATLYGKTFSGDSWVSITSGTSGSITTTATITLQNTVPYRYRYFKIKLQGNATAVTTITSQSFKIWLE